MRLRPYVTALDFDIISSWITDRREHAMWCADRTRFPIEREEFRRLLDDIAVRCGDAPFVVTSAKGRPVGFFCYSVNTETNEGMLKFVMVDPSHRGKGVGKAMLRLAVKYAFEFTGAERVSLCVLSVNTGAKRCYENVGFQYCGTDEGAFIFGDESWDRCRMTIKKQEE
ncbi:MAG: GNAT family N-acetyltransferase [Ruminococcus sp.]|nr:GNAT family N-acetyltransferase [Ruminococcus sp.]